MENITYAHMRIWKPCRKNNDIDVYIHVCMRIYIIFVFFRECDIMLIKLIYCQKA